MSTRGWPASVTEFAFRIGSIGIVNKSSANTSENPQSPAAVLWDMDGTLVDSEPLWLEAELEMLARYGLELTDEIRTMLVGSGLRAAAEVFRGLGVTMSVDEIIDEWAGAVIAGFERDGFDWRPGALELLQQLRASGIPSVMVTMSVRSIAETVIAQLPEGTFVGLVSGDDVAHEKPHPDPYLRGAALVGARVEDCVVIEDSGNGLRSAMASGAVSIGVPNIVALDPEQAHEVWATLDGVDAATICEAYARHRGKSGLLRHGDRVKLTGPKGRMNTITLVHGGEFHTHKGVIKHDALVGLPDGSVVENSSGEQYLVLRPLLSDFVMSMPRGAAIVYPKDAAQIVSLADIHPGARVVEAGVGSGALSLHLLRAIGPSGHLYSFERREEFAEIARANARAFEGRDPLNWTVTVGDLQEALVSTVEPRSIDRVVLDMLAPWECVGAVAEALKPGGALICYVATVTQLSRTVEEIRSSGAFTHPEASETMVRGWHVEGLAVRPDHRMVAHTGFLVVARRLAPATTAPELKRRASKSEYTEEDLATWLPDLGGADPAEVWKPEVAGERGKSDKILRKKAREAARIADQGETGEIR